jgi:SAM-dependent methyltransferase
MVPSSEDSTRRLARELAHDRAIVGNAEVVWNWASPSGRRRAARRAGFFAAALDTAPGLRALELGCGSGVFLERALASRATIIGLDLSADLLAETRRRPIVRERAHVLAGDAERLPFPDGVFDVVYGSSILHHLHLATAFAELRRVLRPGGRLVFAEPNLLNPHVAAIFLLLPRSWNGVSADEMSFTRGHGERALRAAGFGDVASRPFDFLHPTVPEALIPVVSRLGSWIERVPLLREIAGSFVGRARRPEGARG